MPLKPIAIPDQTELEKRFSFIKDDTLRTNTVIIFRYIIFLIALEENEQLPGPIVYSIYKDMIIQTACVVECCVHYTLRRFIDEDRVKSSDVMESEWKEEKCIVLETFGDKQVCGVTRHKTSTKLTKHTGFIDLNRACLRAGIYTQDAFDKAESLREARNKIHLAGLNKVDDLYKKEDVDLYFQYAQVILQCIEKKLLETSEN